MRYVGILLLFFFTACSDETVTHFDGQAMTMHYHVMTSHASDRKKVQSAIDETFLHINQVFNHFNEHSELSRLNALEAYQKQTISNDLRELLELADRLYVISGGKFDPTVLSVQKVWKDFLPKHKSPPENSLMVLNQATGWNRIHLEGNNFWKEHSLAALDLSAIAKGHAIDLLIKRLNALGYGDVYVEWGGEIAVSGEHPSGRPWTIAITSPDNPTVSLETLGLVNQAVATSGDYLQCWRVGDEIYCHIIDPTTKMPLKRKTGGVASATVIAPSCALADGLATTAMLMDDPDIWAKKLQDEDNSLSFWFFTHP